jgi:antitoxin (DNA-binding transcriptional repressor) of toxin-antitoxin stability system
MLKSTRSLKAELSACLRRVQEGEECLVTSHHKIIAKIVPIQSPIEVIHLERKNFVNALEENLIVPKKGDLPLSQIVIRRRRNERY